MIISLIGGSGFIGSRLAKRLMNAAIEFHILDKNNSVQFPEFYKYSDVTSMASLSLYIEGNSSIINLAAEHRDDVKPLSLYDEVNVEGARNICKVANEKGVNKIIFTKIVYTLPVD